MQKSCWLMNSLNALKLTTPEANGNALKAGINCGSRISELRSIIDLTRNPSLN
jgi:hypothetical protein